MKRFKALQACLAFMMLILSVFLITGCGGDDASPVEDRPMVSSIVPLNNAGGVAINKKIVATFSEEMDHTTINNVSFTLTDGVNPVAGTVDYAGLTAIFTPASNLKDGTTYTATITTGAKDTAGTALANDFIWSFTTSTVEDITPPIVTLTFPAHAATSVAINTKIAATFSEAMDPITIIGTTFKVVNTTLGGTAVAGTITYVGLVATFKPISELTPDTIYTATITTGAADLECIGLASNYVWSFTTGTARDTTAPTVVSTNPVHDATGVALSKKISATFSEAMDPTKINTTTFTLKQGTTPVLGTVTYVGLVATFIPKSNLVAGTKYTATITTGVKDLAGNALAINKVWNFNTVTALAAGPQPVDIGTAGNFVILAKSGISTTGTTHITGDIGLSPAAATYITGFGLIMDSSGTYSTSDPSSLVTGKVYAADYAVPTPAKMTTAISDMEIAYTDAAGRTSPDHTELYAGDVTGKTLTPGLYKWSTGVLISAGGVTLSGGANDVWIFQIAQDLTVANTAIVTLSGGAKAENIFWQVAGQTILGTTSQFKGIILCHTLIEIQTGATLTGSALAHTAVTLDSNAITAP